MTKNQIDPTKPGNTGNDLIAVPDVNAGALITIINHFQKEGCCAVIFYIPGLFPVIYCAILAVIFLYEKYTLDMYLNFVGQFIDSVNRYLPSAAGLEKTATISAILKRSLHNAMAICALYTSALFLISICLSISTYIAECKSNKRPILFLTIAVLWSLYLLFFDKNSYSDIFLYYNNVLSLVSVGVFSGFVDIYMIILSRRLGQHFKRTQSNAIH